jgi:DNA-binding transcriptional LysR family regulator
LTPAGKAVMQLSAEMVETIRLVPHLTSQAANQIEGTLSICMISNVISKEFDESLASIHRRHPNVEIKIEIAPWRAVLDAVSSGECDLGITHDSETRAHLRYEPMFRETQQLYCARSHPLYGHRIRDPAALSPERFILTQGDAPADLERFRHRYGLGKNATGHAEDLHEALRLVELGIGIGFLPTIVAEMAQEDRLWPLLPAPLLPTYFIYLVAPPPSRMTTPTQLFLDEIRRRLRAKDDLV